MNTQSLLLLKLMADGEFHSGEHLGESLGVSRAAVWKILESLSDLGLKIERTRGKGYCVSGGVDFLDESLIRGRLPASVADFFSQIIVLPEVASTNQFLLDQINSADGCANGSICLAEMQTAGRGRRGRKWQSPFAQNIYLSLSCCFETGIAAMEGLSLAVGVSVVKAIRDLEIEGVSLKWPNDILVDESKLGGVLIEIAGDVSGQCQAIIGIGLNVQMSDSVMGSVEQPWTDLHSLVAQIPKRNEIIGSLLKQLFPVVSTYETKGFSAYQAEWESLCPHIGREVVLTTPSQKIEGTMVGVDASGALRVCVGGEEQTYVGGEVSLRAFQ
ncbi:MAG: bifunctional biotin--[acetyl-CoA-carboxylase] ligase/biotin operon repressor BirA [Agarilytica sp.]